MLVKKYTFVIFSTHKLLKIKDCSELFVMTMLFSRLHILRIYYIILLHNYIPAEITGYFPCQELNFSSGCVRPVYTNSLSKDVNVWLHYGRFGQKEIN